MCIRDSIEIDPHPSFNFSEKSDFAISFWFNSDKSQVDLDTTDNDIISKWVTLDDSISHMDYGYPFAFRITNQKVHDKGRLIAAQFGGYKSGCGLGTTVKSQIEPNNFHHVVLNVKGGIFFLYLDGKLVQRIRNRICLLYTSPSPRDQRGSRMPSSA